MSYIKGYDPDTLREIVDVRECRDRLEEISEQRSLPALLERVWLLKVLGRLEDSLVLSEQSVRVARMAGTRKDLARARILHASVQQFRGAHAAAEQELTTCAEEAIGQGWTGIAAFAYQHRGKNSFDAGDYEKARLDLKRSLELRRDAGVPDAELEPTLVAIDAVEKASRARAIAG